MRPIEMLKMARDIGVSERMLPDEARTVRFLNTLILATYPLYVYAVFTDIFLLMFRGWPGIVIVVGLFPLIIHTVILLMNHRGRYMLARNFAVITCESVFSSYVLFFGKGTHWDLFFIVLAGLAAITLPQEGIPDHVFYDRAELYFLFCGKIIRSRLRGRVRSSRGA